MNNLPSYLFEDLVIENNMLVVCVEHNKFIPCRACNKTPAKIPYSSKSEDIKVVSEYQNGSSKTK